MAQMSQIMNDKLQEAVNRCKDRDSSVEIRIMYQPLQDEYLVRVISHANRTIDMYAVYEDNSVCSCVPYINQV